MHIHMCISTTVVYVCTHVPLPLQQYRVPDLNLWRGLLLRSRKRRLRRIPVHLPCRSLHQLSTAASVDWLLHENVAGAFSCVCIATTGTASYACSASVVSSLARIGSVELSEPENGCYFDFMFNNCTLISRFMSYMYIKV
jgi:hypothetical protein